RRSVKAEAPRMALRRAAGQLERNGVGVRVHHNEEERIGEGVAMLIHLLKVAAVEEHADGADVVRSPVDHPHLLAIGPEPGNVLDLVQLKIATFEEAIPHEYRVRTAKRNEPAGEFREIGVLRRPLPIDPTDGIVLTVGIVVSLLRTGKL